MIQTEKIAESDGQKQADEQDRRATGETPERCPECSGSLVSDTEHGETRCVDCGLVVEESEIDRGPEWRAFDAGEREENSRVGAPTTKMRHDKGLSTNIGWQDKDGYGNTLSSSQREKVSRLRTWNKRFQTRDPKDRNLRQALGEIDRMASALGLPQTVRETASVVYRRALDADLLPGRSIEGVATAAVYAAARKANTPRSLDELERVSRIDRQELRRTYRYVVRELELEVRPADPASYLPRFVSDLDLSEEVERGARQLLDTARKENLLSGKSPVGLAAAAIYAASLITEEMVTQEEVSAVADISDVTIRNRYRELLDAGSNLPVEA